MAKVLSKNLKNKADPMERYLKLARGICNKKKISYEDDSRLFYAVLGFNKWKEERSFMEYMDEVIEYDKKSGNSKRIKHWEQVKQKHMSEDEILRWAHEEFRLEINQLIEEIKELDYKKHKKN